MKFKLIGGNHCDVKGNIYQRGDVIDSVTDLSEKFPNKFVKVEEDAKAAKGIPLESFQVNTTPAKEPVIPTEEEKKAQEIVKPKDAEENSYPKAGADELGQNVTENFELAKEEGFEVWKRGASYRIVRDGFVVSGKLKKAKVEDFIDEFLDKEETKDA